MQEYAAGFVHGLLQVPDYSRALYEASPLPRSAEERERDLEIRSIRQERLRSDADPLQFVAILDEAVLRNPLGGRVVQRAQLEHLLTTSELPTVSLQVLLAGRGAHPSLESCFFVLSFGGLGEPDMAYVEHTLGATHLWKEPEVTLARLKFDRLRTLALSPCESRGLIRRVAGEL